jgi:hypothetical protein
VFATRAIDGADHHPHGKEADMSDTDNTCRGSSHPRAVLTEHQVRDMLVHLAMGERPSSVRAADETLSPARSPNLDRPRLETCLWTKTASDGRCVARAGIAPH